MLITSQFRFLQHVLANDHAPDRWFHHFLGFEQDEHRPSSHYESAEPRWHSSQYSTTCLHGRIMLRQHVDKVRIQTLH